MIDAGEPGEPRTEMSCRTSRYYRIYNLQLVTLSASSCLGEVIMYVIELEGFLSIFLYARRVEERNKTLKSPFRKSEIKLNHPAFPCPLSHFQEV